MFKAGIRVRLLVNEQFGDSGPRAGDTAIVWGATFDEGDTWYAVFFENYEKDTYYMVREDMIEEIVDY